jgi:Protein of unknown function (DUF3237)
MIYRVRTTDPSEPTTGSPFGTRQHWQVSEATLTGPRIRAELRGTGGDWMQMGEDGFWRPDVRMQFRTADDAIVLMHYTGLVEQSDAFAAAAAEDRQTGWGDQYMRLAIQFDTGAPTYRWLTSSLFVAAGRLLGTGKIEYAVYRIT